ncbi:MAG TPA: YfhO family protein [Rhodanobacteraceae bacterium]|nr:YfhO family protein [Rhodanobacteraceae bacterium]
MRSSTLWYLAAAAIPFALVIANYVANGKALAFADIGADTIFSFYPLQLGISRAFHALDFSAWSFHLGLGGFIGNLFDPLWLVTSWLPLDWQLGARLPTFIIRDLLAGGFMLAYLKEVGFERRYALLGGLCYAFCDYGMINAQWEVLHGTEFLQFSLYLFLLERALRKNSAGAAIAAGAVIGLGNAFGLYEFAFFTALYLAVRYSIVTRFPLREMIRQAATFLGYFLIGLMLVAPLLLPALFHFLDSPRVGGTHSLFVNTFLGSLRFNDRMELSSEISGFLGKNLIGVGDAYHGWANYLEGPSFYIGLLPLLCVTQLAVREASKIAQRLFWVALIGIGAYLLFPFFRYATFGFGHITFRHSTLWISAIILVLGLLGLRRALRDGVDPFALFVAWIGIVGIAGIGLYMAPSAFNAAYAHHAIVLASVYAAILITQSRLSRVRPFVVPVLVLLCVAEFCLQSTPSLTARNNVALDGSSSRGSYADGLDALAFIRAQDTDGGFYRVMKTSPSIYLNDPMAQDYHGTTSYYFHDLSITRFVDRMGIPRSYPFPNYVDPAICCQPVANLEAVRYVMVAAGNGAPWPGLTPITNMGKWAVYRNPDALPFGFLADSILDEAEADAMPVAQRQAATRHQAIIADRSAIEAQFDRLNQRHTPASGPAQATIRVSGSHSIEGTINADQARILVLSMPLDRGWRAQLDGDTVDLLRVDYGLTGIVVPPGKHRLTMNYSPQGRRIGYMLSGLGLLLAIVLPRRRRKARRVVAAN